MRAEELLGEAETIFRVRGDRYSLAQCAWEFGILRVAQGCGNEAILHFKSAQIIYQELQIDLLAGECRDMIRKLEFTIPPQL